MVGGVVAARGLSFCVGDVLGVGVSVGCGYW